MFISSASGQASANKIFPLVKIQMNLLLHSTYTYLCNASAGFIDFFVVFLRRLWQRQDVVRLTFSDFAFGFRFHFKLNIRQMPF